MDPIRLKCTNVRSFRQGNTRKKEVTLISQDERGQPLQPLGQPAEGQSADGVESASVNITFVGNAGAEIELDSILDFRPETGQVAAPKE